jgi:hypothetical protein
MLFSIAISTDSECKMIQCLLEPNNLLEFVFIHLHSASKLQQGERSWHNCVSKMWKTSIEHPTIRRILSVHVGTKGTLSQGR